MVLKNGYVQLEQCVTAVKVEFLDTVHTFIHTILLLLLLLLLLLFNFISALYYITMFIVLK
jgi:hypothetical protein